MHRPIVRVLSRSRAVWIFAFLGLVLAGAARGQVVTEFTIPTPDTFPAEIAAGPDGNLWFLQSGGTIGRITTSGVITEFPLPPSNFPSNIAAGPDGNLWLTGGANGKVSRMTTAGVVTEFTVSPSGSVPYGIASGPDGSVWFTNIEFGANKIGRISTAGVVTGEFPLSDPNGDPYSIAAGPDGNLWFTKVLSNVIGRITTAGAMTGFGIPTANSNPYSIAAGPDGNAWFAESAGQKIGRITPAGVITEFPTVGHGPYWGIVAGPDGNLWFTEAIGNKIGRMTTAGVLTEFDVLTPDSGPYGIAVGSDGNLWFTETYANKIGRITTGPLTPQFVTVDTQPYDLGNSNVNGVLEPSETVEVVPSWMNTLTVPQMFSGYAFNPGPPFSPYLVVDPVGSYGSVGAGVIADCNDLVDDCYAITVDPGHFPSHEDLVFVEQSGVTKSWNLHVGQSFLDVPTSNQYYASVENIFHNGVTGGCDSASYCPGHSVTRAEMAVFLLKGKLGAGHVAPPASGSVFNDVHVGDFAADWIENLGGFLITGGCGNGNYCPTNPVTRAEMAVFLLKSKHGSAYVPPACSGIFVDVACSPTPAFAADWIEQLSSENITAGCDATHYCPDNPITREEMAAFLVKTFGLQLYGP